MYKPDSSQLIDFESQAIAEILYIYILYIPTALIRYDYQTIEIIFPGITVILNAQTLALKILMHFYFISYPF